MPVGSFVLFDQFVRDFGLGVHNLSTATVRLGIITDAAPPLAEDSPANWGAYSANQISTVAGYTGPIALTKEWIETGGTGTFRATSVTLPRGEGGQTEVNAYGIIFNDTAAEDPAIGFLELGDVDFDKASFVIRFGAAPVGSFGTLFTLATVA
jgi:hypothetical protein